MARLIFLSSQALVLPLTALLTEGKASQVLSLLLARQAGFPGS